MKIKEQQNQKILKDTRVEKLLHQKYARGTVIGGTSAGASMMSDTILI